MYWAQKPELWREERERESLRAIPHTQDSPGVTAHSALPCPAAGGGPENPTVKYHQTKNGYTAIHSLLLSEKHSRQSLPTIFILLLVFLIRSRKTLQKLRTVYWMKWNLVKRDPSKIHWPLTVAFEMGFFCPHRQSGLFRTYINKVKIGGAGGDRRRGKAVNAGAVANAFCDV